MSSVIGLYNPSYITNPISLNENTTVSLNENTSITIKGRLDNNRYREINVSEGGHLECEIHGPVSSFNEILTVTPKPKIQHDFVYGLNSDYETYVQQGSGVVSSSNNLLVCTTASNQYSVASYRSKDVLDYRSGQGSSSRFTCIFPSPPNGLFAAIIGLGTSECGLFFGYYGNSQFSIIHATQNFRQIVSLTITTKSSHIQNATVTLNGVAFTVPVTNGSTISSTAYEIASYNYNTVYNGWICSVVGNTINFVAGSSGLRDGLYSISFPTSGAGSFSTVVPGTTGITNIIPQNQWNIDVCDGSNSTSNPSGVLLNPAMGNIFYTKFQYLGFGQIVFGIEKQETGELIDVHRILYANTNTNVSLSNPSMPFNMSAVNITNDTSFSIKCGSYACFNEGLEIEPNFTRNYSRNGLSLTATIYTPVFTIKNRLVYKNRVNQNNIKILNMFISNSANAASKNLIIYLIKDTTLNNTCNYTELNTNSLALYDISATSYSNGNQIFSIPIVSLTNMNIDVSKYNITLEPTSQITVIAYTADTNVICSVSLQWVEDL